MPEPRHRFEDEIEVTAEAPGKLGGSPGGTGGMPGGGGGGGGGAGGGGGLPPIWDWMKTGADKVGGVMGPVGMGMDAFSMLGDPQRQAMEEAKAGSMAAHERNQQTAWQSPEYLAWAQQIWGG